MMDEQGTLRLLFSAVAQLNEQIREGEKLDPSADEFIVADQSKLDSFQILSFVIDVESRFQDATGITIDLTDEVASGDSAHFETIGDLARYLQQIFERS